MSQLRDGHELELLQGGQEYFRSLIDAIDQGRHEVRVETYIFHMDSSGILVAQALERAAVRGVRVYLTMDGVGTSHLPPDWAARFDRCGVSWHIFSPLGRLGLFIPSRWRRLHRKLCVIDGRIAFCGGINVLDDLVDPNHGPLSEPRLDFAVRVSGPLVVDVREAMARFWWRMQLASDVNARAFPAVWRELQDSLRKALVDRFQPGQVPSHARASTGVQVRGARARLVLRDNLRNRRKIERAYLDAIDSAHDEVIVANAYFLPGASLRRSLIRAARRGVRVRLLLQGRYEYFMQYHAARPVYGAMLEAGVEIHEYAASFLHAKVAVVDMRWATVGSSNLDPLSLLLAREANIVMDDTDFARVLRARLEIAMASGGQALDSDTYANRPWRQRMLDKIAYGLMRQGLLLLGRRY
ncbi:MAG: cardiolipin synthase ClsB [Rhodoferax sp.]|nr:cardiolipin synthase ClsB [Rhodoferax sp.]